MLRSKISYVSLEKLDIKELSNLEVDFHFDIFMHSAL